MTSHFYIDHHKNHNELLHIYSVERFSFYIRLRPRGEKPWQQDTLSKENLTSHINPVEANTAGLPKEYDIVGVT